MANKAHSGAKKPSESITPESCQKAKGGFIFSFFFFFRQASSNIMTPSWRFHTKQQHFIAVHDPITFSQLQSLMRRFKLILMNSGFICDIIFFTQAHWIRIQSVWLESWLWLTTLTQCLNRSLGWWLLSPYCMCLLSKPVKTDLCSSLMTNFRSSMHLLLTKKLKQD